MFKLKSFYENCWHCAFRQKGADFLDLKDRSPFKIVQCQKNNWVADPFLFSDDNQNIYVFVELTNTKKSKAVIGAKKIYPVEEEKFKCAIELDGHVSYPCIFKFNNKIYLIPETVYCKNVQLFECIDFPYKWKKVGVLIDGSSFADSTIFIQDDKLKIFLFETFDDTKAKNLYIAEVDVEKCCIYNKTLVKHYDNSVGRPGGHIITKDNVCFRMVQPSDNYYGERLEMWSFDFKDDRYFETKEKTIYVNDLNFFTKKHYLGLHTYNCFNNIEVIDLLYRKFSIFKPIKSLFKRLKLFGFGLYDKTGEMLYEQDQ